MNFKKYHVSRNLFDKDTWNGVSAQRGTIEVVTNGFKLTATSNDAYTNTYGSANPQCSYRVVEGETYTLSWEVDDTNISGVVYIFTGTTAGGTVLINTDASQKKASFTIPSGHNYVAFRLGVSTSGDSITYTNIMLNLGSTALPFEPYSSEVWHSIPHYIHNTSTDTITTLPAVVYPNDTTATVGLKGNMSQTGTPSPENPIQPEETGERTAQLIDYTQSEQGGIDASGNLVTGDSLYRSTVYTPVNANITTWAHYTDYLLRLYFYKADKTFISRIEVPARTEYQIQFPQETAFIKWTCYKSGGIDISDVSGMKIMLNTGSTALPYEPYGYKIPISSNSTTTQIYLGEVETTRKIRKYVCTGDESWSVTSGQGKTRAVANFTTSMGIEPLSKVLSTHYIGAEGGAGYPNINTITVNNNGTMIIGISSEFTDSEAWKSYLAQQYAAGTPVCVWYVLATPTTGIVNESIRKIGDYADTVSGISIPVTAGGDTLSVDTTLQPSEVTVNYKGWHPVVDVHERDNGAWT